MLYSFHGELCWVFLFFLQQAQLLIFTELWCSKHNLSFSQNSDAASATSGSHVALLQLPFLSASSTTSRFHAALLCFLFAARTSGSHSSLLQQAQLYKPAHSHSALLVSFSVCSKHNWGSWSFTAASTSSVLIELYCSKHKVWCWQSFTAASTSSVLTKLYCSKHKVWCWQSFTAASTRSGADRALLQQAQVVVLTELYCSKRKLWCWQSFTKVPFPPAARTTYLTELFCSKHSLFSQKNSVFSVSFCSKHSAFSQKCSVFSVSFCSKHSSFSHSLKNVLYFLFLSTASTTSRSHIQSLTGVWTQWMLWLP